MVAGWILSLILALSFSAEAQQEHSLVRRISVFPIKVPKELAEAADEAWWEVRETLTRDKRFLIASKNFLMQKDVYQARGELSPADAIILGKLLDANALMTVSLEERTLSMHVYEGDYGRPLWEHALVLQPSLPIAEQIQPAVVKLAQDFIAAIPYQGFVTVDPLKGRPLYLEGRRQMLRAEVGINAEVDVGDPVQLVRIYSDSLKPLFTHGASVEIFAEGRVVTREGAILTVEVDRIADKNSVEEGSLVRVPRELKRLQQSFAIQDSLRTKIDPEFLSPGMTTARQQEEEHKPLVSSLVFIANLAAFFLLAF